MHWSFSSKHSSLSISVFYYYSGNCINTRESENGVINLVITLKQLYKYRFWWNYLLSFCYRKTSLAVFNTINSTPTINTGLGSLGGGVTKYFRIPSAIELGLLVMKRGLTPNLTTIGCKCNLQYKVGAYTRTRVTQICIIYDFPPQKRFQGSWSMDFTQYWG